MKQVRWPDASRSIQIVVGLPVTRRAECLFHVLPQRQTGNIDPVARQELVIGRDVAQLDNLLVSNRQDQRLAIAGRASEDDFAVVAAAAQAPRGDQGVEHGFMAAKRIGPRGIDVAQDIVGTAFAADQTDRNVGVNCVTLVDRILAVLAILAVGREAGRSLAFVGFHASDGQLDFVLHNLDRPADHLQPTVSSQIDRPVLLYRLVTGESHGTIKVARLHHQHVSGFDAMRRQSDFGQFGRQGRHISRLLTRQVSALQQAMASMRQGQAEFGCSAAAGQ